MPLQVPGVLKVALKLKNWAGSSCLTCRKVSFMMCSWEQVNNSLWYRFLEYLTQNSLIILRSVFENKAFMQHLIGELEKWFAYLHFLIFSSDNKILMKRWLAAGLWCVGFFLLLSFLLFALFFPCSLLRTFLCWHPFSEEHTPFYKVLSQIRMVILIWLK